MLGDAAGGELSPYPSNLYNAPVQPVPGYKFSAVALNWNTNCGIALGGGVLCWGINVGLGRETSASLTTAPIRPSGEGSFAQLTSYGAYILGRTRDGRLVQWGYADCCGEAVPGAGLSVRAVDVSFGADGYCIIAESGALYCERNTYPKSGLRAFAPIP